MPEGGTRGIHLAFRRTENGVGEGGRTRGQMNQCPNTFEQMRFPRCRNARSLLLPSSRRCRESLVEPLPRREDERRSRPASSHFRIFFAKPRVKSLAVSRKRISRDGTMCEWRCNAMRKEWKIRNEICEIYVIFIHMYEITDEKREMKNLMSLMGKRRESARARV